MPADTEPWLALDTIFDADILNQLREQSGRNEISLKKFAKRLRKQDAKELRKTWQLFFKQFPPFPGTDGETAERSKHKAAALLLRTGDLKSLHKRFGKDFDSRDDFKHFIERGKPEEVARAIASTVVSKKFKRLPDRLQQILRNRATLCNSRSSSSAIVEPSQHIADATTAEVETTDLAPIQRHLKRVHPNKHEEVVLCYKSALGSGSSKKLAIRDVGRLVSEILHFGAKEPECLASPQALDGQPLGQSVDNSAANNELESGFDTNTKKRKRPHDLEDAIVSTQRNHPASQPMGRQLARPSSDIYELDVPAPFSASKGSEFDSQLRSSSPSRAASDTRRVKLKKKVIPLPEMTAEESQLLAESLGLSAPRQAKSATQMKSTHAVAGTEQNAVTSDAGIPSGQSTPTTTSDISTMTDDLLRECLKSTSRKPSQSSQEKIQAGLRDRVDPGTGGLLVAGEAVRKSSKKQKHKLVSPSVTQRTSLAARTPSASSTASLQKITGPAQSKTAQWQLEESLLLECLGKPVQAPSITSDVRSTVSDSDRLPEPQAPRVASPDLAFSPASKDKKKRKRLSTIDFLSSDMLEVDESDYDAQGMRIDKSPTIKSSKKKKHKPQHEDSPTPATATHQLQIFTRFLKQIEQMSFSQPDELRSHVTGKEGITIEDKHNPTALMASPADGPSSFDPRSALHRATLQRANTSPANIMTLHQLAVPELKLEPANETSGPPTETLKRQRSAPSTPRKQTGTISPFFTPSPSKRSRPSPGIVSCIVAPPLSRTIFGLIQEELAHEPFKFLVAIVFLNRTRGSVAIPYFRRLVAAHPTAESIANAGVSEIASFIQPLGLHNQRASTICGMAKLWMQSPPVKGWRFRTPAYPDADASKHIQADEVLSDHDARPGAFEIGHIPGLGAYAYDSWRIFCRDELRGLAQSWNGEGAAADFEPEWKRVLPKDKELRAFLRWMWLKEGWKWDPLTGEKEVASEALMKRGQEGGLKWEDDDL